jgi:hypothetical protein
MTAWVPNGAGSGRDNSIVGGGGSFMAYPQPPSPSGLFNPPGKGGSQDLGNSWNLQAGPVNAVISDGVNQYCVISNPGRSA